MLPKDYSPYEYPEKPYSRRHGPSGYSLYQSFKPWLRDEFSFRCVFCLVRETWSPSGDQHLGVEHFRPKSIHPEQRLKYDNLLYCCNACNSNLGTRVALNPCSQSLADHLRIGQSGEIEALIETGERLLEELRPNARVRVEYRKKLLHLAKRLADLPDADQREIVPEWFGYPTDPPDLSSLRPPENSRPGGIRSSFFERSEAGELPPYY